VQSAISVPWEWKLVGLISGKKPDVLIASEIKARVQQLALRINVPPGMHIAIQGPNFDSQKASLSARIKVDAIADKRGLAPLIEYIRGRTDNVPVSITISP
jgi:hypothetical protein